MKYSKQTSSSRRRIWRKNPELGWTFSEPLRWVIQTLQKNTWHKYTENTLDPSAYTTTRNSRDDIRRSRQHQTLISVLSQAHQHYLYSSQQSWDRCSYSNTTCISESTQPFSLNPPPSPSHFKLLKYRTAYTSSATKRTILSTEMPRSFVWHM